MSHRLARNTIVGITGTVALKAATFASTQVLARGLGPQDFGAYSFVGVYLFFFGFFVDLGMELVLRRELPARPAAGPLLLGNAILLKLILAALVLPLAVAGVWLISSDATVRLCVMIAVLGLPLSIEGLFRAVLQSHYALATSLLISVTSSMLLVLWNLLCVLRGWPLEYVFAGALLNGALTTLVAWLAGRRYVRPRFRFRRETQILLLRDSASIGAFAMLFMLVMRIDQILLYRLRDATELARYAVAVRITEAMFVIPEALLLTWFPMMAATLHTARDRFDELCRLGARCLAAIVFGLALCLTFGAEPLLTLLFGASYASSTAPTITMAWGMYFAYLGAIFLNAFMIQSLQRLLLLSALITGTLNVLLNLVLIPQLGAAGSAWAVLLANVAGFALWFVFPQTRPTVWICLRESLRPAAVAFVVAACTWASGAQGIAAGLLASMVYLLLLVAVGGIHGDDLGRVRRLADEVAGLGR